MDGKSRTNGTFLASQNYLVAHSDRLRMPDIALYCVTGVTGVLGLVGNVMLYLTSRHPKLKKSSLSVHLAFVAVVDMLSLTTNIPMVVLEQIYSEMKWLNSGWFICKSYTCISYLTNGQTAAGFLGLILDRYFALIMTRGKAIFCKRTNARLMCLAFLTVNCFVVFPRCAMIKMVQIHAHSTSAICSETYNDYFFISTIMTDTMPFFLALCIAMHMLWTFVKRREAGNSEDVALGSVLALSITHLLTRVFISIYGVLVGYILLQTQSPGAKVEWWYLETTSNVHNMIILTCINASCKFYVLFAFSSFFRDCVGQILRGDPRASEPEEIQLPGDRRVLRALPGERVIETVTGQEVDITQFNKQRERQQVNRQQSATDSISSNLSGNTVLGDDACPTGHSLSRLSTRRGGSDSGTQSLASIEERKERKAGLEDMEEDISEALAASDYVSPSLPARPSDPVEENTTHAENNSSDGPATVDTPVRPNFHQNIDEDTQYRALPGEAGAYDEPPGQQDVLQQGALKKPTSDTVRSSSGYHGPVQGNDEVNETEANEENRK